MSTPPSGPPARWARYVLAATAAPSDPRTLSDWSRAAGVSRSVLVESCARLRIASRDARDLARVLRLIRRRDLSWEPAAYLDVKDRRTLRDLLKRAGLTDYTPGARPSVEQFLSGQEFVDYSNPGLVVLSRMLTEGEFEESIRPAITQL